ncbi:MAG: trypsin-like serine protease [Gemmatimonadaceae bacterium]
MHRRSLAALGFSILIAAACIDKPASIVAPQTANLIVNGEPTGNSYGNVGALLFDFFDDGITGDDEWCTGSLITPTVFLTAAHCIVTPYTPPGTQFYVSFSPDLFSKLKYVAATSYVYDPAYGHDQANLHDLALVFLPNNSTRGITPLHLPGAGALDKLKASGAINDLLFVNVGYGTSSTRIGEPGFPFDGIRSTSKSEFMGLQPTWLGLLMNTNATGLGGDCYGDSGGPKFIDGDKTTIYATVTTGDYPCRATTWDWRLDTPEARAFLGKYVTLPN